MEQRYLLCSMLFVACLIFAALHHLFSYNPILSKCICVSAFNCFWAIGRRHLLDEAHISKEPARKDERALHKSRQELRAIAVGIKIKKFNQAVFRSPL